MKIKHINLENCVELTEFPEMNQMKSLEILDLSLTSLQSFPEIYGNLDSLSELKLRWTHINGLPTSILGNANSLQKLKLACHSPFDEQFTSLEVVAEAFLGLVCLKITRSGIVKTLDFSRLPYLEKLDLSFSLELVEVHASLGVHKRIKYINLEYCSKLEEFPRIDHMKSLEVLNLLHTSLQSFPGIYGKLDSLRNLRSMGRHINGLPTSLVGNATGLQKLELVCYGPFNEEFTSLEAVADSFLGLVHLEITFSGIVKTSDFSRFPYLEKLNLSFSKDLVEVHVSLGVHKRIESIVLANCSKLVEFPIIDDMNSLEVLDLSGTSLRSFPEITGNVNRLTRLNLDRTKITTLPWSIGQATNLKFVSMQSCENLLTLPVSILGLQIKTVSISSGAFKYFEGSIDDEAAVQKEVELHSPQRKRRKQLIGSEGMGQHSCAQIQFSDCKSLEVLPEAVLSRVNTLRIMECPTLTSWISFKLVDLLENYQHLCRLLLHQREDIAAFLDLDSMSDMLRKREKYFEVNVPGRQIPSWFQYKFSTSSVIVFLPPLSEWYTDKFRGFFLSGTNAEITHVSASSISGYSPCQLFPSSFPGNVHTLVMGIPVDNIRWAMNYSVGQKEHTLFNLWSRKLLGETNQSPRWGLSLVYSEGEVIELDPHQVMIVIDNDESPYGYSFRVNIAESRDVIDELYRSKNPISWAAFQQQTHSQAGTSAMAQDPSASSIPKWPRSMLPGGRTK